MIVTAISGASGPIMGIRLIEELLNAGEEVLAIVSDPSWQIIEYEMSFEAGSFSTIADLLRQRGKTENFAMLKEFANDDFFSPAASGSAAFDAVIIMPCSMKTLSAVANGYADSLMTRACDVALKEKRRCILVPRETPFSIIHIENMLKAAKAGVDIVPPIPGFYTRPQSVDDVIDFIVGKVMNLLGIRHDLFESWGGNDG